MTVGGGVRSFDDISKLLNCGADKVSMNTAAVQNADVVVRSSKKFVKYRNKIPKRFITFSRGVVNEERKERK